MGVREGLMGSSQLLVMGAGERSSSGASYIYHEEENKKEKFPKSVSLKDIQITFK